MANKVSKQPDCTNEAAVKPNDLFIEFCRVIEAPSYKAVITNVALGDPLDLEKHGRDGRFILAAASLLRALLENKMMTERELSAYTGRSVKTLQNHRSLGIGFPVARLFEAGSRSVRYNRLEVDLWMRENARINSEAERNRRVANDNA